MTRPTSFSASEAAREFAEQTDVLTVLFDALLLVDDPERSLTPETLVRHFGWCKARLIWPILFHKTEFGAPGSLHLERLTCGKSNCRCGDGSPAHLHDTVVHVWWDGKRQRREYVPSKLRGDMQNAIGLWQREHAGDEIGRAHV